MHKRIAVGFLVLLGVGMAGQTRGLAQESAHAAQADSAVAERKARGQAAAKAFMLGHYQEALDTYLDLYVQSNGRPEYLRNIGRCQQKLNQYDLAISSLKDYLLRSKSVNADERAEVQGFIAEIQAAKAEASKASPPAAPAAPPVAPASIPPASETAPTPAAAPTAPTLVMPAPAPAPQSPGMSGLKVGGIAAAIGGGVLAAVGTAMLISANSTYDDAKMAGCPGAATVDCGSKASAVSSANTLSKVLFVGAAVAAVAGGTMLYLAPGAGAGTQVGFTTRLVF